MSDYTQQLEAKVAAYIGTVQPELEKLAQFRGRDREFVKRASQAVGTLVGLGLVARTDASRMIDKIAADHTQVFGVLEAIATDVRTSRMGERSTEKDAEVQVDPKMKVWTDAFSNNGN